jgi:hypothetical protein
MKIIKIASIFFIIMLYRCMYASENIELIDIATFEAQYNYELQHIASEQIKQIAINDTFVYVCTKKGNVYRTHNKNDQHNVDLNAIRWTFINTEGDVSFIALYPKKDQLNMQNFIYARHSYLFKDRLFSYNSTTQNSAFLTGHNRAIYIIGAVFDEYNKRSCLLSASAFPSIQLYTGKKLTPPLKNGYLLYAQENQLVYAELESDKKADELTNRFNKAIGKKLSYKIHIVWNTAQLDTLILPKSQFLQIKTDEENDLIVAINNVKDLPLIAMNNVEDKIQTVAIIVPQQKELHITFNYHFDEELLNDIVNALPDLTVDQKSPIVFANTTLRTNFDFKKIYYTTQPNSILNKFKNGTFIMKRSVFEPISATYLTYTSGKNVLDDISQDRFAQILLLVYQNSVECIFVKDWQNNSLQPRKFLINFSEKKILCTCFDQASKILYCVTEDKKGNIAIENKHIITELKTYFVKHAEKTKKATEALQRYHNVLKKTQ